MPVSGLEDGAVQAAAAGPRLHVQDATGQEASARNVTAFEGKETDPDPTL